MATVPVASIAREVNLSPHSAPEIASSKYFVERCPSSPLPFLPKKEIAKLQYIQQEAMRMVKEMEHSGDLALLKQQEFFYKRMNICNYLIQNGSLKIVCF